jgi:hypothetical protein
MGASQEPNRRDRSHPSQMPDCEDGAREAQCKEGSTSAFRTTPLVSLEGMHRGTPLALDVNHLSHAHARTREAKKRARTYPPRRGRDERWTTPRRCSSARPSSCAQPARAYSSRLVISKSARRRLAQSVGHEHQRAALISLTSRSAPVYARRAGDEGNSVPVRPPASLLRRSTGRVAGPEGARRRWGR